jgi:predicted nucleic acid-binding protein
MLYLLDTNVISELRKGPRCDPAVAAWEQAELIRHGGAISVITIGEIRKGIALLLRRDPQQAAKLENWLQGLYHNFSNRILPITIDVAEEWGRLNATRPLPAADSLLCATANVHNMIFATRNLNDLRDVSVRIVNPFTFVAS